MLVDHGVAQVAQEVLGVLKFMEYVYDIFGMSFTLMLSTRPESVSEPARIPAFIYRRRVDTRVGCAWERQSAIALCGTKPRQLLLRH